MKELSTKHNGFAIALAWPATNCKQAGAWYDRLLYWIGLNNKGYYKVGHAAVVLVSDQNSVCHYFDFGRYHAPHGFGRVRSALTDHDLRIRTKVKINKEGMQILNITEILQELLTNPSTHGDGTIHASVSRINFEKAFNFALYQQQKDFIVYGPFISNGTNCSRFVNKVIQKGKPSILTDLLLKFPFTISPTPMWNIKATCKKSFKVDGVIENDGKTEIINQQMIILNS